MSTPIREDLLRLLRAVAELEPTARDGWVPWARVAKRLEGSEEFTQLVKAFSHPP